MNVLSDRRNRIVIVFMLKRDFERSHTVNLMGFLIFDFGHCTHDSRSTRCVPRLHPPSPKPPLRPMSAGLCLERRPNQ